MDNRAMERQLANLVRPACWGFFIALGLWLQPVAGQTAPEAASYQAALAQFMDGFVRGRIDTFFKGVNLPPPASIEVATTGSFGESLEKPGEGQVADLQLSVTVTTDQPTTVIRELRQSLARGLSEQGYRLDTEGVASSQSSVAADLRPHATLTLNVVMPEASALKRNDTRQYLTLGAIALAFAASLTSLIYLLILPWRRRRRRRRISTQPIAAAATVNAAGPEVRFGNELPEIAVRQDDDRSASPKATVSREEVMALRFMPFEKVLEVLAATPPAERLALIERLELSPPLKRRLQMELVERNPSPQVPVLEPT